MLELFLAKRQTGKKGKDGREEGIFGSICRVQADLIIFSSIQGIRGSVLYLTVKMALAEVHFGEKNC